MKPIKPVLLEIQKPIVGNADVASSEAIMVTTYSELQELIAQLSILNKRYVLYFRGQKEDYTSDDNAKKPEILILSNNIPWNSLFRGE